MEGPEIKAVEAVIDNGSFGKRTLRFETGRLAQQADGAVAAYLDDDSMILSTTTAGSSPKENYDFFPLTVDVEEKMYAAGKIPGSFFRREGRPSSEAILACRIIDRPLRPLFPHTLRNEVQVVETVLAVNPDDAYDVIALNAASASTMISGLPFEGPVSGVRLALIDGQWVAFPRWSERERAVFEIVVAGRVIENGDVAIAMIEAGAGKNAWHLIYDEGQTKPDEEVVAGGLEAAKPFIKVICEAQDELKKIAAKETKEFQLFPEYTDELYARIDEIAHQDLLGDGVLDVALNHAAQRTGTEQRVEALLREQVLGGVGEFERHMTVEQAVVELLDVQIHDLAHLRLGELLEDDDVVQTVQELRAELLLQFGADLVLHALVAGLVVGT